MQQTTQASALAAGYAGPDRRAGENRDAVAANERIRLDNLARYAHQADSSRPIDWHGVALGTHADLTRAGIAHPSLDLLGQLLAEQERRALAADVRNSVNKFAYTDRLAVELELDRPRTAAGCHL